MSRRPTAAARRGGPGRRPLLSPEVEARWIAALEAHMPMRQAATVAGVADRTVFRWLERGEAELDRLDREHTERADPTHPLHGVEPAEDPLEAPYVRFCQRTARARAEAMGGALGYLDTAAKGGFVTKEKTKTWYENGEQVTETETSYAAPEWRAAAWLLERSFAGEFGPKAQELRLAGADGGPVQLAGDPALLALASRLTAVQEARRAEQQALPAGDEEPVDAVLVDEAEERLA